eukprot:274054-Prymnesium_polylepis.1
MARVDVGMHPSVAAQLCVADKEIPALRVLRGDVAFGYPLRAATTAGEVVQRMIEQEGIEMGSLERDATAIEQLESSRRTHVVARLSHAESVHAFEQVAAAFAGLITFAIASPAPPAEAIRSGPAGRDAVEAAEAVELFRERSAEMEGEPSSVRLPATLARTKIPSQRAATRTRQASPSPPTAAPAAGATRPPAVTTAAAAAAASTAAAPPPFAPPRPAAP